MSIIYKERIFCAYYPYKKIRHAQNYTFIITDTIE